MPAKNRTEKKIRTTVTIPEPLYEEARSYVNSGLSPTGSINSFFVNAILAYVRLIRRKQIDAKFATIAEDSEYQKEASLISEEFDQSDWEAFESVEKDA